MYFAEASRTLALCTSIPYSLTIHHRGSNARGPHYSVVPFSSLLFSAAVYIKSFDSFQCLTRSLSSTIREQGRPSAMDKSYPSRHAQTPPSSPCLNPSLHPISLQDLQKVLVEINKAASKLPDSVNLLDSLDQTTSKSSEADQPRIRASKLDYKAVNEMCV